MAIYKDPRTTKKVSIPSIPGSEVEIYNTLLWGDLEEINNIKGSDVERGREILVKLIKDWNLTDENSKKLPITSNTFKTFTVDIMNQLLSYTDFAKGTQNTDLKKNEIK